MVDELELDRQLCFALHAASRATTAVYRPVLDELGLTYPQYLAMLVLWERDGISVSDLGARLQLDSGTLSPLLKRLAGLGLVERHRSSSDERRVVVDLTEAGRGLRERAAAVPRRLAAALNMPLEELVALRETLVRLTDSLHDFALHDFTLQDPEHREAQQP
ncbi:MAG TPA: MarR family transcriptional regulator [Aldersonia sp.]